MGINSRALYQCLREDLEAFSQVKEIDHLRDTENITAKASISLYDSFYKKLQDDPIEGFEDAALTKFIALNGRMASFKVVCNTSADEMLYGSFVSIYNDFFDRAMDTNRSWWTLDECFHHGRPGPGSSIKANGEDFYTKLFSSPLSTTSLSLYRHYVDSLTSVPLLAVANFGREQVYGQVIAEGNRLSFVPKTRQIARTICTEPNLNMFYQLGLGRLIERELQYRFGIDMSLQPERNRELARIGSIDGSFCTIDLSSASDTISWSMIQEITKNKAVLGLFEKLRSPKSVLPDGQCVELHMISTMGNGFTFPLQTLIFVSAVSAVMHSFGVKPKNRANSQNFAVFGDDIILPNYMFDRMVHLLTLLGFEVNAEKSFNKGAFRESCGHDYYCGHNIRGVYIKTLRMASSRYSAINRLNRWSCDLGIPLPRTIGCLMRSVRFLPVPPFEQDDAGVQVPLSLAKGRIHYDRNWSYVYLALVPDQRYIVIRHDKVIVPRHAKKRSFNYEGLVASFIHGSLRHYRIGLRANENRHFRYKARRCPTWDYLPSERFRFTDALGRRLWDRAVWINLIDTKLFLVPQV